MGNTPKSAQPSNPGTLRWTYDYGLRTVRQVRCERVGHPYVDEDGSTQYENTHYDDEDRAWAKLLSEARAGVSLDTRARKRAREEFERCTVMLADSAEALRECEQHFEERKKARAEEQANAR